MDAFFNANSLFQNRITPEIEENRLFYSGDHWQKGKGLIVKKPVGDMDVLRQMQEGFASQNVIAEIVDRRRDGILGREPNWRIVRKDGTEVSETDQKKLDEMAAALVDWWNERSTLAVLKNCLVDAMLTRRGVIRPFSPTGLRDSTGNIRAQKTIQDALRLLYFERVSAAAAGVFLEENTLKPYSVFQTLRRDETLIDFSFVDGDGITHFKTFRVIEFEQFARENFPTSLALYITQKTGGQKTIGENSMDLAGKLHLFEIDLERTFVTEPIKSKQRQINLNLTMQGRNTYTAGFRERHFLGADAPDKLNLGAGSATYTQGVPVYNQKGEIVGTTQPSLVVIDPVPPVTFISAEDSLYRKILAEAEQLHVLQNDSANSSGISRSEARDEFRNSLRGIKAGTDALGRYVLEFAIAFAASLTNQTAFFEQFRVDFDSIISAGVPSPEEKADNRTAYETGEISLETLMSRNGTEDPDAELARIKSEDGYELNLLLEAAEKAGAPVPLAAIISLMPLEDVKRNEILALISNS